MVSTKPVAYIIVYIRIKDTNYKMDLGCSGYIDNCRKESNDTKREMSYPIIQVYNRTHTTSIARDDYTSVL